ncbi:MAG: META domain-containing protein [Hyphomicrobiales bacterium]
MPFLVVATTLGLLGLSTVEDLTGSRWHPSAVYANDVSAEERIFVEFKPDGKVTGIGGCNRFFGGYAIEGDQIRIGPIASTKMGCPGKFELETSFFSALQAAKSWKRDGTTLMLLDANGQQLARFFEVGGT